MNNNMISIDRNILENICKYCETQAIYDKLSSYGDFYYKIKKALNDNPPSFNVNDKTLQSFNEYISWLQHNNFESEIMNNLAQEIASNMSYYYRFGYEEFDPDTDTYKNIKVDPNEPDILMVLNWSIESIKNDADLLKEYGISSTSKTSRKCPYLKTNINWDAFNILDNN